MHLLRWTLVFALCVSWKLLEAQNIEEINSNKGIYFDEVGRVLFYPKKRKIVIYINLEPKRELWKQTIIHETLYNFVKRLKVKAGSITHTEYILINIRD
jgi:hypothetical protein